VVSVDNVLVYHPFVSVTLNL